MSELIDPNAWYITRDGRVLGSAHPNEESALDAMDFGDHTLLPVRGMVLLGSTRTAGAGYDPCPGTGQQAEVIGGVGVNVDGKYMLAATLRCPVCRMGFDLELPPQSNTGTVPEHYAQVNAFGSIRTSNADCAPMPASTPDGTSAPDSAGQSAADPMAPAQGSLRHESGDDTMGGVAPRSTMPTGPRSSDGGTGSPRHQVGGSHMPYNERVGFPTASTSSASSISPGSARYPRQSEPLVQQRVASSYIDSGTSDSMRGQSHESLRTSSTYGFERVSQDNSTHEVGQETSLAQAVTARAYSLARAALDEPTWVPYGDMFTTVIAGKIAVVVPRALDEQGVEGSMWWVEGDEIVGGFSASLDAAKQDATYCAGYAPQMIDIVADVLRNNPRLPGTTALNLARAARG